MPVRETALFRPRGPTRFAAARLPTATATSRCFSAAARYTSSSASWRAAAMCQRSKNCGGPVAGELFPRLESTGINVVNLMKLPPQAEHPHRLSDDESDTLFNDRQADHLCRSRVSVADPPADVSPNDS